MGLDNVERLVSLVGVSMWCLGLGMGFVLGMLARPAARSRRELELAAHDASTVCRPRGAL
jgi:hypothetical protein